MVDIKDNKKGPTPEELILEAARRVFVQKGFDGARMQEIADEAGVNKALVHYYYRSKDNLFEAIFSDAFKRFWPSLEPVMAKGDVSVKGLIRAAVNGYMDILIKMPYLPMFVVGEINRSPGRIEGLLKTAGIQPQVIVDFFQKRMNLGEVVKMNPREIFVNIVGLCVFPFISKPLLCRMLWESTDEYDEFIEKRRDALYEFICRAILVNP
ncbi:TetR/AcrR family transcriptional regulator [Geofilum sp. OHC36d9]|uniref:TetR/AcrR family transcriptional regulator n=1 Tax=Geofilum sp. OHC36d9 TaxID=3458413 RepID=UPI0040346665